MISSTYNLFANKTKLTTGITNVFKEKFFDIMRLWKQCVDFLPNAKKKSDMFKLSDILPVKEI